MAFPTDAFVFADSPGCCKVEAQRALNPLAKVGGRIDMRFV
jgi:hypothetical protein